MTPGIVGAIIGFFIGLMGYLFIRLTASRIERNGVGQEPAKVARMLRLVALLDLIFFVVAGYFIGPYMAGAGTATQ